MASVGMVCSKGTTLINFRFIDAVFSKIVQRGAKISAEPAFHRYHFL